MNTIFKISRYLFEYLWDFSTALRYNYYSPFEDEKRRLYFRIIILSHAIEKGLSLKYPRKLFGVKKIRYLIDMVDRYDHSFAAFPVQMALGGIESYVSFHRNSGVSDPFLDELESYISSKRSAIDFRSDGGVRYIPPGYFPDTAASTVARDFIRSRFSCRNYGSEQIAKPIIDRVIELAQSAPSQCNRQATRVHCYQDKGKIESLLKLQGGTSGFTEVVANLFIITSELTAWGGYGQRSQGYVDAGLFAQNLMLSLHAYGLASCPLNLAVTNSMERKIKSLGAINERERLVMMISFGEPGAENLLAARSARVPLETVMTMH